MVKIGLKQIMLALNSLEVSDDFGKNAAVEHLENAIKELSVVKDEMEIIPVQGREKIDILFGCMLGLDYLIGEEVDNG